MSQEKNHVQLNIKNKNKKLRRKKKQLSHPQPKKFKKKMKKKEKKKGRGKKAPKKKKTERIAHVQVCTWAFSSIKQLIFSLQFSPHFGEKTFLWAENTQASLFIFLSSYPTKHISKKFLFPFSFQSFPLTLFHIQTNTP